MRVRKALIATAALVAASAIVAVSYWHVAHSPTEFERSTWIQGETAADNPRLRMVDGLLGSEVLLGKSRAEIEAMLGPPTSTNKFRDSGLVYWLGPERGFISVDSEWLTVDFDQTGKARDVQVVTD